MDCLIDPRGVNKHALIMLKSSVSVDKSIAHTLRTKVKALPSEYSSIDGGDSIDASIYAPLSSLAHRPHSVKEALFLKQKSDKKDQTDKAILDVFKTFSVRPGDIPFDGCEASIPVGRVLDAFEVLYHSNVLKNASSTSAPMDSFPSNAQLTFSEFREFVHYVMLLEESTNLNRLGGSSSVFSSVHSAAPDSYKSLVQKQRMASSVVLDDLGDAASLSQASSRIRLQGKLMNASVLSDAMIEVLNEKDRSIRVPVVRKPMLKKAGKSERPASRVKTASTITDSVDDNDAAEEEGEEGEDEDEEQPEETTEEPLGEQKPPKPLVNHNPTQNLQKSAVSSLVDKEQEYYAKWHHMRQRRDVRLERDFKRRARQDMMQTFQRVVHQSEKNEKLRAKANMTDSKGLEETRNREVAQRRRHILTTGLTNRLNAERLRKQREAQYIRETLRTGAELSRSMRQEELEGRLSQSRSLSGHFELDESSSSVIHIPTSMISRVKSAKSLLAYEAAKKEIKAFYESTLSERIKSFSRSKEFAVLKASRFGTPLSVAPMDGGEFFFDDSIFDESDSESLALTEYFKHRGKQGRILDEDSGVLSPLPAANRSGPLQLMSGGVAGISL